MPKLLVIADDLTGATDTGVQFAKKGIATLVLTEPPGTDTKLESGYQVIVVNTESRHVEPAEAVRRVAAAYELGRTAGASYFYKKTDSTLRGNLGSELAALLKVSGGSVLPYAPALPDQHRTTVQGVQFVEGQPVHETVFGRDPLNAVNQSYIPAVLKQQTQVAMKVVKIDELDDIQPTAPGESAIYVFDSTSDSDLRRVGETLRRLGWLSIVAGSAGLAEHLPDLIEFEQRSLSLPRPGGQMLVINGSLNQVSLKQVVHAEANGFAAVTLSPEILLCDLETESSAVSSAVGEVERLFSNGHDVLLRSVLRVEELAQFRTEGVRLGLTPEELHLRIAENAGRFVAKVLRRTGFSILTVLGGDTLVGIARAVGWTRLLPRGEPLAGVTVSEAAGHEGEITIVTKAGGFGSEDILLKIKTALGSV